MRRVLAIAAVALVASTGTIFAQQPPAAPGAAPAGPPKIQALILTGNHAHNWKGTTPILRKILEDTGKFEVKVMEEVRGATAATFAPYQVIILNYSERGRPEFRWGAATDAAFLDAVRGGKGVVVYHFAMQAFDGWTDYEKITNANWRP